MAGKTSGGGRARKARASSGGDRKERVEPVDALTLAALFGPALTRRHRKLVAPGTRLALALSRDERNLVLHNWSVAEGLTDEQLQALKAAEKPELEMTLPEWDDFGGWVAATGNHARSGSRLGSRADRFFDRIQALLDSHAEERVEPDAKRGDE